MTPNATVEAGTAELVKRLRAWADAFESDSNREMSVGEIALIGGGDLQADLAQAASTITRLQGEVAQARDKATLCPPGGFSNDPEALALLKWDIEHFPQSAPVGISLAPGMLYISWPNDDFAPDKGNDPYHCVSIWLAPDNVVAREIHKRRAMRDNEELPHA